MISPYYVPLTVVQNYIYFKNIFLQKKMVIGANEVGSVSLFYQDLKFVKGFQWEKISLVSKLLA